MPVSSWRDTKGVVLDDCVVIFSATLINLGWSYLFDVKQSTIVKDVEDS